MIQKKKIQIREISVLTFELFLIVRQSQNNHFLNKNHFNGHVSKKPIVSNRFNDFMHAFNSYLTSTGSVQTCGHPHHPGRNFYLEGETGLTALEQLLIFVGCSFFNDNRILQFKSDEKPQFLCLRVRNYTMMQKSLQ